MLYQANIISPYFEKVLANAYSLQNYGDLLVDVLRKEICALKFRKMHTKTEKKNNNKCILSFFIERNTHITSILVYCSVQCLFCFRLVIWKVQEVPQ